MDDPIGRKFDSGSIQSGSGKIFSTFNVISKFIHAFLFVGDKVGGFVVYDDHPSNRLIDLLPISNLCYI